MFRKTMILAMAVGIVAAMALPASAGASWKHNGVATQQNVQLPFTGTNIKFESQTIGGGLGCQVTSEVTFEPGTTGKAKSFKAHPTSDTTNCFGTGGLAFCQVHNLQPQTGFQWVIHTAGATTTSITITHGTITSQTTGGFCPFSHLDLTPGTLEGHADAHKFSTIQITGKAHVIIGGQTEASATISGLLHLEGTPTYEI
jgi:hypothetical protein